jgi:hypothetical protein
MEVRMRSYFPILWLVCVMLAPGRSSAAGEDAGTVLKIDAENVVVARQSKSPDRHYALAWTPKDKEHVDWAMIETNVNGFYDKYDAAEVWVVDLQQPRKLDTLASASSYIRPGIHRTLAAAWGRPDESGRRFALGSYDWKWGTDTLYLLDVGPQETRHAVIGPQLDAAVAAFLKQKTAQAKAALNITYGVAGLPEHGTKSGFADGATVLLPFTARVSPDDRPMGEGVITLKLDRQGRVPAASVVKITRGAPGAEPFTDDSHLAKADAELNQVYTALLKKLGAAKKAELREEQRAWIEQRDKKAAETPADAADSARVLRDRTLTQLTQERVEELRKRLEGK